MTRASYVLPLLFSLLAVVSFIAPVHSTVYPVSAAQLGHLFQGIGGLSGGGATSRLLPDYIEPYRSDILDYLFTPNLGASLHVLKVEIGGDAQSTEGTEPSHQHTSTETPNFHRGYQWWIMREAKQRNPHIKLYALPWGFPGWVSEGGNTPLTNSTVQYVVDWVSGARDVHGLHIDYVGVWNEKDYQRQYILTLRRQLDAANLTATKIIAADGDWGICDQLVDDDEYAAAIYAVGAHYPNSQTTTNCTALQKPLWASEDFSTIFTAGGCWARLINRNYALSNLTSTISWNLLSAFYDELPWGRTGLMHAPSPWSGWYEMSSAFWVTAHTTQFTRYGWHYLPHGNGSGALDGGGSYVSLTDGHGALTIVMEAMTANVSKCQYSAAPTTPVISQTVRLQLGTGFEHITQLNMYYSHLEPNSTQWFVHWGAVPVNDGIVVVILRPNELVTLSTLNGTKTSLRQPPPRQPFPLPYSDSFDSYPLHSFAAYLDDQSGSWEVVASTHNTSRGNVLRQMMPAIPVSWCWCGDAPLAYTVIGEHSWQAVHAEVDVLIEQSGTAFLAVAASTGGCVCDSGTSAIVFAVTTNGTWIISNSTTLFPVFQQGSVAVKAGQWVRLGVELTDAGTTVYVDGVQVGVVSELTSDEYNGWVALGSSYDAVQYDNLAITEPKASVGATRQQRRTSME